MYLKKRNVCNWRCFYLRKSSSWLNYGAIYLNLALTESSKKPSNWSIEFLTASLVLSVINPLKQFFDIIGGNAPRAEFSPEAMEELSERGLLD